MSSRKRKKRGKQSEAESAEVAEAVDAEDSEASEVEAAAESGEEEDSDVAADGGEVEVEAPAVSEISELKPRRKRKRKGEGEEAQSEPEPEPEAAVEQEEEDEDVEAFGDDAAKEAPKTRAQLKRVLESLIFVSDQVITAVQLGRIAKTKVAEVREALAEISVDYDGRGIELVEVNGGYQFRSVASSGPYVRSLVAQRPVRLTRAQLETLALIAYRQPITRPEVDDVRGVDSGSAIKVLLDRELIKILGRKDDAGRPLLYGTTPFFLEFFGMNTMQELPTLREFTELSDEHQELFKRKTNEIGDLSAEAEVPVAVAGDAAEAWSEEEAPAVEAEPAPAEEVESTEDVADLSAVAEMEEDFDAEDVIDLSEGAAESEDAEVSDDGELEGAAEPESEDADASDDEELEGAEAELEESDEDEPSTE